MERVYGRNRQLSGWSAVGLLLFYHCHPLWPAGPDVRRSLGEEAAGNDVNVD